MLAWVRGCMGGVPWKGNWVVLIPKEKIQVYPNPGKFKGLRKAPGHGQNPVSQSVKSYYYLYFDSLTFSHISPTNTDFSGGGPISNVGKVISQACPVFIHSFFCIDIALMMLDKPD